MYLIRFAFLLKKTILALYSEIWHFQLLNFALPDIFRQKAIFTAESAAVNKKEAVGKFAQPLLFCFLIIFLNKL